MFTTPLLVIEMRQSWNALPRQSQGPRSTHDDMTSMIDVSVR